MYHDSASVSETGHGRESAAVSAGESFQNTLMNIHRFVLLKHAMSRQFGQPDVEDIVTFSLEELQMLTHECIASSEGLSERETHLHVI